MNFDEIISGLNNKVYHPVYLLFGDESYYIDELAKYIENNLLSEEEKEFNQTVVYGKDVDEGTVIGYAKRFPMMANYQVVIVKEAQDLQIDKFEAYLKNPLKSTILVLCYKYKKLDKRKSFMKSVKKTGVLFESAKLYDNKIPSWISNYVKKAGYRIQPKSLMLLSEYLGADLGKIVNEISKVILNVEKGKEITPEHIETFIGISKDYNIFELQSAFGSKDFVKANRIINYFAANPRENPLQLTVFMLYNYFRKVLLYRSIKNQQPNSIASALSVHPFFLNEYKIAANNYNTTKLVSIMKIIRVFDLQSKGVGAGQMPQWDVFKEVCYKILH